jgi:hypothetical protein
MKKRKRSPICDECGLTITQKVGPAGPVAFGLDGHAHDVCEQLWFIRMAALRPFDDDPEPIQNVLGRVFEVGQALIWIYGKALEATPVGRHRGRKP